MGYLTPDVVPGTFVCRALFIPDDEAYIAIMRGLLQELTLPESWDKFGALTPSQAAQACQETFDRFCLEKATCRMIGEIIEYAGISTPNPNWLVCDGAEYSIAGYPDLYAVIGGRFGTASADNFRVPDFRKRSASGASASLPVGTSYGSEAHTLTVSEMPSHNHADAGHQHTTGNSASALAVSPGELPVLIPNPIPSLTGVASANIGSAGNGDAFEIVGPRLAILHLIVAKDG